MMQRFFALLAAFLMTAGLGVVAAGSAQAAPAVISNYCAHPTYAPGGTNGSVRVHFANGSSRNLACGSSAGGVYVMTANYPTRYKQSNGSETCHRAGSTFTAHRDGRVWTVRSC